MDSTVELIHRIVAYPLAFVLAPLALVTFSGLRSVGRLQHRGIGRWYFYGMTFLYVTGTFLTLTRHPWSSWEFARNVAFNLFGFSTVLFGVRAMVLYRRGGAVRPGRLDYGLAALLLGNTAALVALSFIPGLMMRAFAVVAAVFLVMELRELRAGFASRDVLYRRHIRYVLASYFYVLTVASIVHLGAELSRNAKWLWPSVVGAVVVCAATGSADWWRRFRAQATRIGVTATIVLALSLGAYATWELWSGRDGAPFGNEGRPDTVPHHPVAERPQGH
jgi:hypothetical protein